MVLKLLWCGHSIPLSTNTQSWATRFNMIKINFDLMGIQRLHGGSSAIYENLQ